MSRGQVWEYVVGSRQYRVLVISNDEYNEEPGLYPWGLVVDRAIVRTVDSTRLLVILGAEDPLSGSAVDISTVVRIDETGLRANFGFVTEGSMDAVERGLRDFLALP